MKKLWLSWSSGKDSAWALHRLRDYSEYEVCGLFTTVNQTFDRVAMHAVRRGLLQAQAAALGLPLNLIYLPWPCSNTQYESIMTRFCLQAQDSGISALAFGDLFLEDVRQYRIDSLSETSLEPIFPLWLTPTPQLAEEMIDSGMQATLTCIDPRKLPRKFAGRNFDSQLLADLPPEVDPCGENGEFHTFVFSGPMFDYPLSISPGRVEERDGFVFADLELVTPDDRRRG